MKQELPYFLFTGNVLYWPCTLAYNNKTKLQGITNCTNYIVNYKDSLGNIWNKKKETCPMLDVRRINVFLLPQNTCSSVTISCHKELLFSSL